MVHPLWRSEVHADGLAGNRYTHEERQAEYMRKMILAMSRDIRVLLIKLADRLHGMRTLQYHSPEKQQQVRRP